MAECPHDDDDIMTPGYKPPAQKSLADIKNQDADDESLQKYKETLLGNAQSFSDDPRNVVVKSLSLVIEGRDDVVLDLTGDLTKLKDKPFSIKEGTSYKLKVKFAVNHEIVTGLRLLTVVYRAKIKVDKGSHMMGSYGPKPVDQEFTTAPEEAPSGLTGRGKYKVKCVFIDDDSKTHCQWEWNLEIHKDWHDGK